MLPPFPPLTVGAQAAAGALVGEVVAVLPNDHYRLRVSRPLRSGLDATDDRDNPRWRFELP